MNREQLLTALFPAGCSEQAADFHSFTATGEVGDETVQVIGSANAAEVGGELALKMARAVLDTVRDHPGRPILFLLDTQGQRLRRRDEMLGLNGYMAHLAKCVEIARHRGHPILSLVYGQAVSGGYLTTGMMADACYALADAEIKVMNLPAMARITKIPLARLEELAARSPVFSPGVDNYFRMGHVLAVWSGDLAAHLQAALAARAVLGAADGVDRRMQLGQQRGGRNDARPVVEKVLAHV
jgi:malonate decarboxylase gamma subunit